MQRRGRRESHVVTEAALQRAIIKALETEGCYVANIVVAGRAGTPDLLVCVPRPEGGAQFLALEVKLPAGRVTPLQRVELQRVEAAGGTALVVRSVSEALAAIA